MKLDKHAIITLDIIESRKMSSPDLARFSSISQSLAGLDFIRRVEVFRGDGLQTQLSKAMDGCRALITQYCYFKMNKIEVRQALGVGTIEMNTDRLATSVGKAFEISGQALDHLKGMSTICNIQFQEEDLNREWWVHSAMLAEIMRNWSSAQAEAVYYTLVGETQTEIADRLKISQAAIHQRLKSAKIHLLNLLINRFKSCV